jgi:hypothetical protein
MHGPCVAPLLGASPPVGNHPTTSPHIVSLSAPNQDGNTGKQFWKSVLFVWFRTNPIFVGYETRSVGKIISSFFHAYVERTKQRADAIWALILRQGGPVLQIVIEVKFGNCSPTPALACAPPPSNLNPKACYFSFPWYKSDAPLLAPLCSPRRPSSHHPLSCPSRYRSNEDYGCGLDRVVSRIELSGYAMV